MEHLIQILNKNYVFSSPNQREPDIVSWTPQTYRSVKVKGAHQPTLFGCAHLRLGGVFCQETPQT